MKERNKKETFVHILNASLIILDDIYMSVRKTIAKRDEIFIRFSSIMSLYVRD
jgi:hypothetical protein